MVGAYRGTVVSVNSQSQAGQEKKSQKPLTKPHRLCYYLVVAIVRTLGAAAFPPFYCSQRLELRIVKCL